MKKINDLEKRLQVLEDKFLALEEDLEDEGDDFDLDDGNEGGNYVDSLETFVASVRIALANYDQDNAT